MQRIEVICAWSSTIQKSIGEKMESKGNQSLNQIESEYSNVTAIVGTLDLTCSSIRCKVDRSCLRTTWINAVLGQRGQRVERKLE
jgi:hypothetical protein